MQEKNFLKAFNSFAIEDVIDGVDSPLITLEARIDVRVDVSAAFVSVGASGGFIAKVEIDLYDPFPETSGGLVSGISLFRIQEASPFT